MCQTSPYAAVKIKLELVIAAMLSTKEERYPGNSVNSSIEIKAFFREKNICSGLANFKPGLPSLARFGQISLDFPRFSPRLAINLA